MTLNSKESALLEKISEDPWYSNWFFGRQNMKMVFPLKEKQYFVPTKISWDADHASFWPLDYLERLSGKLKTMLSMPKN